MTVRIGLTLAAIAIFLSGCSSTPQRYVELTPDTLASNTNRIGVAMTPLPKPDIQLPGASCLLCMAAASLGNATLTAHTKTLSYEDLPKLKSSIAGMIRKKGAQATVIVEDIDVKAMPDYGTAGPDIAKKDFSSLQKKHNIDKLLVIDITTLGMQRTYSAYVPMSAPKAVLQGTGYMVNLKNNTYEWYMPVNITKSSDNEWDEPPKFPGLTNAYFQALETGKDRFLEPFSD